MAGGQLLESFRILKRIAVGGFGTLSFTSSFILSPWLNPFVGVVDEGIGPNGEQVAIKRELASDKVTRPILEHEYHIYKALEGPECILNARVYGRQNKFNVMVMDLLGPSLSDRFQDCAKRFSLKTTARLAIGMVSYKFYRPLKIIELILTDAYPVRCCRAYAHQRFYSP